MLLLNRVALITWFTVYWMLRVSSVSLILFFSLLAKPQLWKNTRISFLCDYSRVPSTTRKDKPTNVQSSVDKLLVFGGFQLRYTILCFVIAQLAPLGTISHFTSCCTPLNQQPLASCPGDTFALTSWK